MKFLLFASLALAMAACSTEQAYNSLRGMQRTECNKRPDAGEREQCLRDVDTRYDDYEKQRGQ